MLHPQARGHKPVGRGLRLPSPLGASLVGSPGLFPPPLGDLVDSQRRLVSGRTTLTQGRAYRQTLALHPTPVGLKGSRGH